MSDSALKPRKTITSLVASRRKHALHSPSRSRAGTLCPRADTPHSQAETLRSRASRVTVAALLIAVGIACACAPAALAGGQLTVFSCHAPNGEQAGNDGWTIARSSQAYMSARSACEASDAGGMSLEVGASPYGYPNGAHISWVFAAPAWASIAKYDIDVASSDTFSSMQGIAGQADVIASDETDDTYDYRNLGGGAWGASTVERTPPDPVKTIAVEASCDGEGGPCPAGAKIASLQLSAATIVLHDSTAPEVSKLEGPLASGAPLSGNVTLSFTATDDGPGIYSAWLVLDGSAQPPSLLDAGNGNCVDLGLTQDGSRSFASAEPCAKTVSASLSLDTTGLSEGKHNLELIVDDASGNATIGFDGTITVGDAGNAGEGAGGSAGGGASSASAQNGTGAGGPAGAGGANATSNASSEISVDLAKQAKARLRSAPAWKLELRVKPVIARRGTRLRLFGKVLNKHRPPRGKLVYLQARSVIRCGGWPAAVGGDRQAASAHPRAPMKQRAGSRSQRACRHESWITFRAIRSRTGGRFGARYRFRLGGRHTYQFRAVAPAEGGYANRTGLSRVVTVQEWPR